MEANTNKFLQATTLQFLENWSVQYLLDTKVDYNPDYELVSIGDFLIKSRNKIQIEDKVEYQRVTVRANNGGVVPRNTEIGINIGTKQQYITSEGQFIMSKIDARNGAFGLVPKDLDNAIVTNDFPLFNVDKTKINSEFLVLITTTKAFIKFAQSCSSGTTNRQRIDVDMFLNVKIPLPSLTEQNRIIKAYNKKIQLAGKQENEAELLKEETGKYLFKRLGIIKINKQALNKGLNIIAFSETNKWGIDFIGKNSFQNPNSIKSFRIKELCSISSGGTPSRGKKEYYNGMIPWIKTGELNDCLLTETGEKITEAGLLNSSAKLYPIDSLVVAMYGATIGKTAKLGVESSTNQACAVLFNINKDIVETDYLWVYIQSQINELKELAYGSAQPNLNAGIIGDFKVFLPNIDLQVKIKNEIFDLKEQIKHLKQQAKQNRESALKEFEKEIFAV